MKVSRIFCAAALLLTGCALEQGQWVKPDTTQAQWKKDNYECTREATYQPKWAPYPADCWCGHGYTRPPYFAPIGPQVNQDLYEMCLEARGYEWSSQKPK